MTAYQKMRPPRGLLAFFSSNVRSLEAAWEKAKHRSQKNPHDLPSMMIDSENGKGKVEFIDLMKSLPEM